MKGAQVPQGQYKKSLRPHNPKVVGSNPAPATNLKKPLVQTRGFFHLNQLLNIIDEGLAAWP
jgi:hypothetical protein